MDTVKTAEFSAAKVLFSKSIDLPFSYAFHYSFQMPLKPSHKVNRAHL